MKDPDPPDHALRRTIMMDQDALPSAIRRQCIEGDLNYSPAMLKFAVDNIGIDGTLDLMRAAERVLDETNCLHEAKLYIRSRLERVSVKYA